MSVRYIRYEAPGWRDARAALPLGLAEEIREKFMPPDGCLLLAYDPAAKQKVVGSAAYTRIGPGICEASRVVVGWESQRKGIGRGLMEMLMAEARKAGYRTMRVEAPRGVPALAAFFERLGFRRSAPDNGPATVVRFEMTLD